MTQHEPLEQRRSCQLTFHNLPVTALTFLHEDAILSGEGGILCLYSVNESRLLNSWRIFDDQAIHGIVRDPACESIVVYGGRYIRVTHLEHNTLTYRSSLIDAEDWILDAAFWSWEATFITAHNALLTLEASKDEPGKPLDGWKLTPRIPGANTILYSAHIITTSQHGSWLIAAGTAFGDVIIWSCKVDKDRRWTSRTHYSFSAHEGSTFGVRLSCSLTPPLPGGETRLLATCSDDRTVRVWDISNSHTANVTASTDRSTGFGSQHVEDTARPPLLAKAMGHVSRIWHVRFDRSVKDHTFIRSFGEDATTIDWLLTHKDGGSPLYNLNKLSTFGANAGKHIWSVAEMAETMRSDKYGLGMFAVGGGDGAIVRIPKTSPVVSSDVTVLWPGPSKKDDVKSYQFLDANTIVMTTVRGTIQVVDLQDEQRKITHSFEQPELASYSLVTCSSGTGFVGGTTGSIYVYQPGTDNMHQLKCLDGKITALFAHETGRAGASQSFCVLTMAATKAILSLQHIELTTTAVTVHGEHQYDLKTDASVTSSAFIATDRQQAVAVGLRSGEIAIYPHSEASSGSLASAAVSFELSHTDAITSLLWVASSSKDEGTLLSTSRDSTYALTKVRFSDGTVHSQLLHRLEIPIGANLEGLALTSEGKIVVHGFCNKHFVLYSVTDDEELYTVECGGAHRNWTTWSDAGSFSFMWTQRSKLHYHHQPHAEHKKVRDGGHGREIKAVAISPDAKNGPIVATAGQDTDIKLWQVANATDQPICIHTLKQHNTGPQHLLFSEDGDYLFSSGGFEEFLVWRLHKDCPVIGLGVVCESVHPRTGKSDLRITSFDVDRRAEHCIVTMAYSDSRITVWSYSQHTWHCLADADYLTACPTSITSLDPGTFAMTATDGHLSLWQDGVGAGLAWTTRHRIHQSAILSSSCHSDSQLTILATGGDDNAVTFTKLDKEGKMVSLTISRAHAAAVTALQLCQVDERLLLFSAGLDQRFIVWQLEIYEGKTHWLKARKLQVINTGVADVSGLGLLSVSDGNVRILITGVGMEIWTVPIPTA